MNQNRKFGGRDAVIVAGALLAICLLLFLFLHRDNPLHRWVFGDLGTSPTSEIHNEPVSPTNGQIGLLTDAGRVRGGSDPGAVVGGTAAPGAPIATDSGPGAGSGIVGAGGGVSASSPTTTDPGTVGPNGAGTGLATGPGTGGSGASTFPGPANGTSVTAPGLSGSQPAPGAAGTAVGSTPAQIDPATGLPLTVSASDNTPPPGNTLAPANVPTSATATAGAGNSAPLTGSPPPNPGPAQPSPGPSNPSQPPPSAPAQSLAGNSVNQAATVGQNTRPPNIAPPPKTGPVSSETGAPPPTTGSTEVAGTRGPGSGPGPGSGGNGIGVAREGVEDLLRLASKNPEMPDPAPDTGKKAGGDTASIAPPPPPAQPPPVKKAESLPTPPTETAAGSGTASPQDDNGKFEPMEKIKKKVFEPNLGTNVAFVLDRSKSMRGEKSRRAREDLVDTLEHLGTNKSFYVAFFPLKSMPGDAPLPATPENVQSVTNWIYSMGYSFGSDPGKALEHVLDLNPDTVWLLSDGKFSDKVPAEVRRANELVKARIHTIGFYDREGEAGLRQIAEENLGTYRFVPGPNARSDSPPVQDAITPSSTSTNAAAP